MPKVRYTHYITAAQHIALTTIATDERLPVSEIVRRALDAYLAWRDPQYQPEGPSPRTLRQAPSPTAPRR